MDELPDFAGENEPVTETLAEAPQQPAAEPSQEPQPEAAATPAPEPEPQAPEPTPQPQAEQLQAPLSALLDEREKRQAAERKAQELQQWRDQQEAQFRRQQQQVPDRFADPEAYEQFAAAQQQAALFELRRDMSRQMAEVRHGPDVVKAAFDWGASLCDRDPHFNAKVKASPDPMGLVVEEWKRDQLLQRLDPNDLDAFQQWKAQQAGATPAAPAVGAQPPARPAAPRPSIATAPSAGASSDPRVKDGGEVFQEMFG